MRCIIRLIDLDKMEEYDATFTFDVQELTEAGLKLFNRQNKTEIFMSNTIWLKLEMGNKEEAIKDSTIKYYVSIDGREVIPATTFGVHAKTGVLTLVLGKETKQENSSMIENKFVLLMQKGTFSFVKATAVS